LFEKFKGNIIWSADEVSLDEIVAFIKKDDFPREHVAIKLDRAFMEVYGLESIAIVQNYGVPVFDDGKPSEIPYKIGALAKNHLKFSPWMSNIMAATSSSKVMDMDDEQADALYRWSYMCKEAGTLACAVTVPTSEHEDVALEKYGKSIIDQVMYYADFAVKAGYPEIVCSAAVAKNVREAFPDLGINSPAIRLPKSSIDDQSADSVRTPRIALANGVTRLVIGRDLSRNGQFAENYQKILANIDGRDLL
jgi:orotidine-5'-phosphate decarboxylase